MAVFRVITATLSLPVIQAICRRSLGITLSKTGHDLGIIPVKIPLRGEGLNLLTDPETDLTHGIDPGLEHELLNRLFTYGIGQTREKDHSVQIAAHPGIG